MSQTRHQSLVEAGTNIVVGLLVALATQLVVFPLMGIPVRFDQNLTLVAIFTVVSLVRSYALRRFFIWIHE